MLEEKFLEILDDNYITPFKWDIKTQGQMNGIECIGGNSIKLAKLPNGIKIFWNSKNDFETACLLDDVNRGLKITHLGTYTFKQFRNFYFWSVGEISEEEKDTEVILEISGNAPFIEYFISSPSNIGVIGKVDVIGKIENVENVGNVPTPTPPPEDPEEPYENVKFEHKLKVQTSNASVFLMLFSATGETIPNNYTLNNAKSMLLFPIYAIDNAPTIQIFMLPLGLAEKWFPNTMAISQNSNGVNTTTLAKASSLNYIASYNGGKYESSTTIFSFHDGLKMLCELCGATSQNAIKEIAESLVIFRAIDAVHHSQVIQLFGKSGAGNLSSLQNGLTFEVAAVNYPKHFQYKNNTYGNTYLGNRITLATDITYQIDDGEIISIPNTTLDKTNLQSPIYKLWD